MHGGSIESDRNRHKPCTQQWFQTITSPFTDKHVPLQRQSRCPSQTSTSPFTDKHVALGRPLPPHQPRVSILHHPLHPHQPPPTRPALPCPGRPGSPRSFARLPRRARDSLGLSRAGASCWPGPPWRRRRGGRDTRAGPGAAPARRRGCRRRRRRRPRAARSPRTPPPAAHAWETAGDGWGVSGGYAAAWWWHETAGVGCSDGWSVSLVAAPPP